MLNFAIELAREAGQSLLSTFGRDAVLAHKSDHSNVVTAADLRCERLIVAGLRQRFPDHSIIAEESGCDLRGGDYTWVIDPLDGTSNYAAGILWFGVLIALLHRQVPVAAVLHTPALGDLYTAEAGAGAYCNGTRIRVSCASQLSDVLWAYGMDGGVSAEVAGRHMGLLSTLLRQVRNVRATNSLVDAAYTADGRLGGMLNHSTRLWDIAAPMLIVQEAGGCYTDVAGRPLVLDLSQTAADTEYAVLAGATALHGAVAALVRDTQVLRA